MEEDDKNKIVLCQKKLSRRKWIIVILVLLIIFLIGYIIWKGVSMLKLSRNVGYLALNGYWHIAGERYLLINGPMIQIIDITKDKIVELFKISNADIKITKTDATYHRFKISNYTADINTLELSGPIDINITPSLGLMQFVNAKSNVSEKLVKDNEMSLVIMLQ